MPRALLPLHLLLLLGALGGWATPTTAKTLRIGVPARCQYPKYVTVKCEWTSSDTCFSGHAINIFRLVWKNINNGLDYEFIRFNGSYDSLIQEVSDQKFDAAVGDTSIVAKRTQSVEFSRPYTQTGARMVVLEKGEGEKTKAWIFVKPFTKTLWVSTAAIFLYNGIIVWLIERAKNEETHNLIWLSFTTFFPIHGEGLRSNLSKMAMVVWLFVALILTQSYTANLTSMLTSHRLAPLLKSKGKVGCAVGSFMSKYLEERVGIGAEWVETYQSGEFAEALSSGAIKAAFLEIPSIELFLNENPKGFTVIGPTYEIGGYAFVFPIGSDLVGNVSNEILRLRESGTLRKLQEQFLSSPRHPSIEPDHNDENERLSIDGFWGLFIITGGTSTLALVLFLMGQLRDNWECRYYPQIQLVGRNLELIFRSNRIPNNQDQGPHHAVDLGDFRCNAV